MGRLIASAGSRPVTRAGLVAMSAALALVALAPPDVAMNAHRVAVERRMGRPILSTLHAGWSVGGLVGAGIGGALAAAGAGAALNLVLVPAAACGLALAASRALLPAAEDAVPPVPALRRPPARVALLGLIAFCCLFAEGVAADWSAVYLEGSLGAGAAVAATG